MVTAGEVGELDARRSRHDDVARIWVADRSPRACAAVRIVEERGVAVDGHLFAVAASDHLVAFPEEDRLGCRVAFEQVRKSPRLELAARQAVDHAGAIRGGYE